ncbi:MAG: LysM peptidoglycan-binding domain-containing protein [Phenylobacterium sp.]|nr:LysM peptidoglycan-binding domain-containing protein [Phenylobacterium sp.]
MALRTATPSPNLFRSGAAAFHASFNDIYAPLNPGAQGQAFTATTYRVTEGDTLRTVALKIWGDEGLWYVLAQANGLNGTEPLAANRVLVVPNKVVNAHNKSSTFRVYDPGQVLGDIQPQQPAGSRSPSP